MKKFFQDKKILLVLFICALAILGYFMLVGFSAFFSRIMELTNLKNYYLLSPIFSRFTLLFVWILIARIVDVKVKILWNFKTFIYGIGLLAPVFFLTYSRFVNTYIEYKGNAFDFERFGYDVVLYMFVGAFEEYWFRGVIYNLLRENCPKVSKVKLIVFQALLFGVDHFFPYLSNPDSYRRGLNHVVNATIIGITFGIAYELSNSLLAVALLHALWDLATNFGFYYENNSGTYEVGESIKKYTIALGVMIAALSYLEALAICRDKYFNDYEYMVKRKKIPKFVQDIIDEMYV